MRFLAKHLHNQGISIPCKIPLSCDLIVTSGEFTLYMYHEKAFSNLTNKQEGNESGMPNENCLQLSNENYRRLPKTPNVSDSFYDVFPKVDEDPKIPNVFRLYPEYLSSSVHYHNKLFNTMVMKRSV